MAFCYNGLWKMLIDKGLTKEKLRESIGASSSTISKMSKNEYVSMEVLNKICNTLNCRVEDVVEHMPDGHNNAKGEDNRASV